MTDKSINAALDAARARGASNDEVIAIVRAHPDTDTAHYKIGYERGMGKELIEEIQNRYGEISNEGRLLIHTTFLPEIISLVLEYYISDRPPVAEVIAIAKRQERRRCLNASKQAQIEHKIKYGAFSDTGIAVLRAIKALGEQE